MIVKEIAGTKVISSVCIAKDFGMLHNVLVKKINKIMVSANDKLISQFIHYSYVDKISSGKTKLMSAYDITYIGFKALQKEIRNYANNKLLSNYDLAYKGELARDKMDDTKTTSKSVTGNVTFNTKKRKPLVDVVPKHVVEEPVVEVNVPVTLEPVPQAQLELVGKHNVGSHSFTHIEGAFGSEDKHVRCMLVRDIERIHERKVGTVNQAIKMNREHFIDNIDIIDLRGTPIITKFLSSGIMTTSSVNASKHIYVLSETGYFKLLKIINDKKSWEVYNELVSNYFSLREQVKLAQTNSEVKPEGIEWLKQLSKATLDLDTRIEKSEQSIEELRDEISRLGRNSHINSFELDSIRESIRNRTKRLLDDQYTDNSLKHSYIQLFYAMIRKEFDVVSMASLRKCDLETIFDVIENFHPGKN